MRTSTAWPPQWQRRVVTAFIDYRLLMTEMHKKGAQRTDIAQGAGEVRPGCALLVPPRRTKLGVFIAYLVRIGLLWCNQTRRGSLKSRRT